MVHSCKPCWGEEVLCVQFLRKELDDEKTGILKSRLRNRIKQVLKAAGKAK